MKFSGFVGTELTMDQWVVGHGSWSDGSTNMDGSRRSLVTH